MYCNLCHIETSPSHNNSSGHRAAKELAAAALDRLSSHLAGSGDSAEIPSNVSTDTDKSAKTPEAVSYCDSCNGVYPINDQSAHFRSRPHALALLEEQTFEELVQAYSGNELKLKNTSESSDDGIYVDEAEAVKTYTCHICAIEVPRVFKAEHERSSRHRTCRTLAVAAANRARDALATSDRSDRPGDKFSGKMMRKLLKIYTKKDEEEITEEETIPTKPEPKLTAKQYFKDILPFVPYVGTFNNIYVDDTEFITIQIGSETLKIHVNNLNGLSNFDGHDGHYNMKCGMCDAFSNVYYNSLNQQDKFHVMSLGHIKNLLTPIDNVHMIRKIDDSHWMCVLCNVHVGANTYSVENHILKDTRHTTALAEALERGNNFKETKDQIKITIYVPPAQKPSIIKPNPFCNQNRWTFGIPQQPRNTGSLFGVAQGNTFGAQTFGGQQTQNAFGSTQSTGFGTAQSTGFGGSTFGASSTQNTGFGSQTGFGAIGQSKSNLFGVSQNNSGSFGNSQNNSAFGAQNSVTGFGAQSNTTGFGAIGQSKSNLFGASPNNSGCFGVVQNNSPFGTQNNTGFGAQNNTNGFGAQNTSAFGSTGFGASQNAASVQNNATGIGTGQNNTLSFGAPQNNTTGLFASQNPTPKPTGEVQIKGSSVTAANKDTSVGAKNNASGTTAPIKSVFGAAQNNVSTSSNQIPGFGASPNKYSIIQKNPSPQNKNTVIAKNNTGLAMYSLVLLKMFSKKMTN